MQSEKHPDTRWGYRTGVSVLRRYCHSAGRGGGAMAGRNGGYRSSGEVEALSPLLFIGPQLQKARASAKARSLYLRDAGKQ